MILEPRFLKIEKCLVNFQVETLVYGFFVILKRESF